MHLKREGAKILRIIQRFAKNIYKLFNVILLNRLLKKVQAQRFLNFT